MSLKSRTAMAVLVCLVVFSIGCGDTFRPIAIPIIQTGGQPQAAREVVALSTAGTAADGQTMHINVSGDTDVGQVTVGRDPVHIALVGAGSLTVVVNRAEESLSLYSTFAPSNAQPPTFISLCATNTPCGKAPVFAYSNVAGVVYVAESGVNKIGVVTGNPTVLSSEINVGTTPVGLVGTPDGTRLFVANKGDGTVNVIDTGTNAFVAALPSTITVGSAPVYLAVNNTGTQVFSVNSGSGSVSVINTATDTATNVTVGSSPNFAVFDSVNNRLWVTNPGSNSVSSINVDANSASYLAVTNIPLTASCGSPVPQSVTVLADGSRAYVADSGCASVSVINTLSNTVTKTIAVGSTPVFTVSSADSSKVYTANSGSGNVSVIRTFDDTVVTNLPTPSGTSPIYLAISPF